MKQQRCRALPGRPAPNPEEDAPMELAEVQQTQGTRERVDALEGLVEAHGDAILRLAYFHLKDRDLAEDVFQETFTKVYLQWHTFRGDSSPRTWIYRIAVNLCRDKLRSWTARKVSLLGEQVIDALHPPEPDSAEEVLRRADRSALLQAVMALPAEYREVIHLYYYEEMDVTEVATTLGLSGGTVRSRLFRARARLKTMLMEGGFTHGGE
jgi:RNA polymerase sigma-70 factor (ECF subfamily)